MVVRLEVTVVETDVGGSQQRLGGGKLKNLTCAGGMHCHSYRLLANPAELVQ